MIGSAEGNERKHAWEWRDKGRCVGGSGGMEVVSIIYSQGEVRVGWGVEGGVHILTRGGACGGGVEGGVHILSRGRGEVCLGSCSS